MRYDNYTRYTFSSIEDLPFCPRVYSCFKHGSSGAAEIMANDLSDGFLASEQFENIRNSGKQIILVNSPYYSIKSASSVLRDYLLKRINLVLFELGLKAATSLEMTRDMYIYDDYGKLSEEERESLLSKDVIYLDKEYIKGKVVLFVDDVRITGAHERLIENLIKDVDVDFMHVHFASYLGENPDIEGYLNTSEITTFDNVVFLFGWEPSQFFWNMRNIKLTLRAPKKDFELFMEDLTNNGYIHLVEELFYLSVGSNYHTVSDLKENLKHLKTTLDEYSNNYIRSEQNPTAERVSS